MKYEIGDIVELKNGCIVEITNIHKNLSDEIYISNGSPIPEDRILRKIEQ